MPTEPPPLTWLCKVEVPSSRVWDRNSHAQDLFRMYSRGKLEREREKQIRWTEGLRRNMISAGVQLHSDPMGSSGVWTALHFETNPFVTWSLLWGCPGQGAVNLKQGSSPLAEGIILEEGQLWAIRSLHSQYWGDGGTNWIMRSEWVSRTVKTGVLSYLAKWRYWRGFRSWSFQCAHL